MGMAMLVHLTQQAGLDGVVLGITGTASTMRLYAFVNTCAERRDCTAADIAASLVRRVLAFVLRRGRGRHRMWRNYAKQRTIRADWPTLRRWS